MRKTVRDTVRDNGLLDALEAMNPEPFLGRVWRVVRDGKDPCLCAAAGGRWDDGTFDVLYTSAVREGALAEAYFHVSKGQPFIPSQIKFRLFELSVSLARTLKLPDIDSLTGLGVEAGAYGRPAYNEKNQEYPRTQDIAEAAHFLGHDGLQVPSARRDCLNVVVFCDAVEPGSLEEIKDCGLVDWDAWKKADSA